MDKNTNFYFDEDTSLEDILDNLIYESYKERVEIE